MEIAVKLDTRDYLTLTLYRASKSDMVRRKRKRSRNSFLVVYVVIALIYLFMGKFGTAALFLGGGVLWYALFPAFERKRYINHYQKYIKQTYGNTQDKVVHIDFQETYMHIREEEAEARVAWSEVEEIDEIPGYLIIRYKSGQAFIINKNKIENPAGLVGLFRHISATQDVPYQEEPDWKWT